MKPRLSPISGLYSVCHTRELDHFCGGIPMGRVDNQNDIEIG
jgi:hypothetical protein